MDGEFADKCQPGDPTMMSHFLVYDGCQGKARLSLYVTSLCDLSMQSTSHMRVLYSHSLSREATSTMWLHVSEGTGELNTQCLNCKDWEIQLM